MIANLTPTGKYAKFQSLSLSNCPNQTIQKRNDGSNHKFIIVQQPIYIESCWTTIFCIEYPEISTLQVIIFVDYFFCNIYCF